MAHLLAAAGNDERHVRLFAKVLASDGCTDLEPEFILPDRDVPADALAVLCFEYSMTQALVAELPVAWIVELNEKREAPSLRGIVSPNDLVVPWTESTIDTAVAAIARWVRGFHEAEVTPAELAMVEVIVRELKIALDEASTERVDPHELAQALAAIETATAQMRAPKPGRRILRLALAQIPGFAVGLLTNTASAFLLHWLTVPG